MNSREYIEDIVSELDAIDCTDPERAHSEADDLLLAVAPVEVVDAYKRLVERAKWWAAS
jgi:hypothetical protein